MFESTRSKRWREHLSCSVQSESIRNAATKLSQPASQNAVLTAKAVLPRVTLDCLRLPQTASLSLNILLRPSMEHNVWFKKHSSVCERVWVSECVCV
jgi:hypothetical protein